MLHKTNLARPRRHGVTFDHVIRVDLVIISTWKRFHISQKQPHVVNSADTTRTNKSSSVAGFPESVWSRPSTSSKPCNSTQLTWRAAQIPTKVVWALFFTFYQYFLLWTGVQNTTAIDYTRWLQSSVLHECFITTQWFKLCTVMLSRYNYVTSV